MKQKPFIKKFKTDSANYIYDVNSNELLQVDRLAYDIIAEIGEDNLDEVVKNFSHKYKAEDIRRKYKGIKEIGEKHNLFSHHRPEIFSGIRCVDDVKFRLNSPLRQLILELSNRCNLRCKYCTFSGEYPHQRSHGIGDMKPDVAKRAVEFFIARSNGGSKKMPPAITFYGGEPLLKFDLLEEVVQLTKRKGVFENYSFSLTSNGTLLDEEVIGYLARNNISIRISLNGPREIHDRFRVFADGKGTFDVIIDSLKRIKKYNRSYFENNISFNAVVTPPYTFDAIIDFFYRWDFLEPLWGKVKIDFVNAYGTNFFKDFHTVEEVRNFNPQWERLLNRYRDALIDGTYDELTIEKAIFLKDFYRIARRELEPLEKKEPPLGTCTPGKRRLFVDVEGGFYMCEKVGANYKIGDIDNGFDYEAIYHFYEQYDEFFKDCKNCWALRFCTRCFNNINKGSDFDRDRRNSMCQRNLEHIEKNLITFCSIIEENPDAFKVFAEVNFT